MLRPRIVGLVGVLVLLLASASSAQAGAPKPQCGSAGDITSYCVTWAQAGFGITTLQVANNGSGMIFAFRFTLNVPTGIVSATPTSGGNNCSVTGSEDVLCSQVDLETGYAFTLSIATQEHLNPGASGTLTLYDAGGDSQGAVPVTLQGGSSAWEQRLAEARAKETAALEAIKKAETDAREAEVHLIMRAHWDMKMAEEARLAHTTVKSAVAALTPKSDAPTSDISKLVHLRDDLIAGEDKLEIVTEDTTFSPAQYGANLGEADDDVRSAEIITEQVM